MAALLTAGLAFALVLAQAANLLSPRTCAVLAGGLLLCSAWFVWPILRARDRGALLALFALSIVLQIAPEFLHWSWSAFYAVSCVRLVWVFAAWASVLSVLRPGPWHAGPALAGLPGAAPVKWVLLASAAVLLVVHWVIRGRYGIVLDEVLYMFQSRHLSSPGYGMSLDPSTLPFFMLPQSFYAGGMLVGQYPPGWPVALYLADRAGLAWLLPPALGVLCVGLTYLLGKQLHSRGVGVLAGVFLTTSQWFLLSAGTYYSHIATMCLCVAAVLALVYAEGKTGRALFAWGCACGLFLGAAIATRPLTGAAAGGALAIWVLMRGKIERRHYGVLGLAVAVGALLPLGLLLSYNLTTTGSPWRLGYQAANGALHDYGFGVRGVVVHSGGSPHAATEYFGPGMAVQHFLSSVRDASLEFTPFFLIVPVLFASYLYGFRYNYKSWLAFAVLPAVHVFYFMAGARFYSEMLPFLMVVSAILVTDLGLKHPRVGTYAGVLFLSANLVVAGLGLRRYATEWHDQFQPYFDAVERMHQRYGRVLVFARDGVAATPDHGFVALSWLNTGGVSGDTVIARDLGAANERLMRIYPQHCAFLMSIDATWRGSSLPEATLLSPECQLVGQASRPAHAP